MAQFEMNGVRELIQKLEASRAASGPAMRKALRAGGKVIERAMEERAPVLDEHQPGSDALPPHALRDGIRTVSTTEEEQPEVLIGPNAKVAHVARFVEYGHRQVHGGELKLLGDGRTRGTGMAIGEVPPYPFLRPAFEASLSEAEEVIAASLRESLKEVMG